MPLSASAAFGSLGRLLDGNRSHVSLYGHSIVPSWSSMTMNKHILQPITAHAVQSMQVTGWMISSYDMDH